MTDMLPTPETLPIVAHAQRLAEAGADDRDELIDLGSHRLNLRSLLETRMLIQGSSGAGKSYLLRKLLEQSADRVQQIVIDPEGEFSTLRERFPYILCAVGGDIAPRVDTAVRLAHEIRRSRASIIVDVNDLDPDQRCEFVGAFTLGLLSAPQAYWTPALCVIDEAHQFAPDKAKPASFKGVEGLACRGRKRGLGLVVATQRLAKLHKDLAAEQLNKFIGRTGLDIDIARASEELGWTRRNARAELSKLEPGQFYAHGPALSTLIQTVRVGRVETTHGTQALRALPPPVRDLSATQAAVIELHSQAVAAAEAASASVAKPPIYRTARKPRRATGKTKRVRGRVDEQRKADIVARVLRAKTKPWAAVVREADAAGVAAQTVYHWVRKAHGPIGGAKPKTRKRRKRQ